MLRLIYVNLHRCKFFIVGGPFTSRPQLAREAWPDESAALAMHHAEPRINHDALLRIGHIQSFNDQPRGFAADQITGGTNCGQREIAGCGKSEVAETDNRKVLRGPLAPALRLEQQAERNCL